jgi:hypothetical protein
MSDSTLNIVIKVLCFFAFGLIIGHYLKKCSKTEQKPTIKEHYVRDSIKVTDTIINNIVRERIKIKTKLDTLNEIIYVPRDVIIKDSVLCDSLYSLAIIQKKMISNDSNLISKLNVNIKNYKKLDTLQQNKIDSLIKVPKNRLKWFSYGFGAGVIIGSVIK